MNEIVNIPDVSVLPAQVCEKINAFIAFYNEKISSNISKLVLPKNDHIEETGVWNKGSFGVILILNTCKRIVGLLHYHKGEWEGGEKYFSHGIMIEPNYVGKGKGKMLMEIYIKEVIGESEAVCTINEANIPSIQFHTKFGFERSSQVKATYPEHMEYMENLELYWYYLNRDLIN